MADAVGAAPQADGLRGLAATGSIVELELAETVSSKTHQRGDPVAIRLAEPIRTETGVLVPAGVTGRGEVISAAKAGMLGKAGELLLAARYLEYNGQKIPLRTFRLGASGQNNAAAVLALGMVVPVSFLIKGGDIEIPAGARANAKLAADLDLPIQPDAPAADTASTIIEQEAPL